MGGNPGNEQSAILARGYGCVNVDVLEKHGFEGLADMGGDIRLSRAKIDTYPQTSWPTSWPANWHKIDDYSTQPGCAA